MIRQARHRPHRAPASSVALRLGPVVLAGTTINAWLRRLLEGPNPTPRTTGHTIVIARPGCRQPDWRSTSIAVRRHHLVPGLEPVAGQERPSAGQQLHHLAGPASHGNLSAGRVAAHWRVPATRAAPRGLTAAIAPAGRAGGRRRLMAAPSGISPAQHATHKRTPLKGCCAFLCAGRLSCLNAQKQFLCAHMRLMRWLIAHPPLPGQRRRFASSASCWNRRHQGTPSRPHELQSTSARATCRLRPTLWMA